MQPARPREKNTVRRKRSAVQVLLWRSAAQALLGKETGGELVCRDTRRVSYDPSAQVVTGTSLKLISATYALWHLIAIGATSVPPPPCIHALPNPTLSFVSVSSKKKEHVPMLGIVDELGIEPKTLSNMLAHSRSSERRRRRGEGMLMTRSTN